jgi:hypothetical protein
MSLPSDVSELDASPQEFEEGIDNMNKLIIREINGQHALSGTTGVIIQFNDHILGSPC